MKNKKIKYIDENTRGIKYSDIVRDFEALDSCGWFVLVRKCVTCEELYLEKYCCISCLEIHLNCTDEECEDCEREDLEVIEH